MGRDRDTSIGRFLEKVGVRVDVNTGDLISRGGSTIRKVGLTFDFALRLMIKRIKSN